MIDVGSQFFHVGEFRPAQRVGVGPTKSRAEHFEQVHLRLDFASFLVAEVGKPPIKNIGRFNVPHETYIA